MTAPLKIGALRVLFVIPGDGRGSSMIFVRRQAESLLRQGVEVRCFYLASRTSPRMLVLNLFRFRSELSRFNPTVVHAHYGTVTAMFAALASGRTPLIVTYLGSDLNLSGVGRWLSQFAALRAARIVCVSRALRERLWWKRGCATVLPTGVDRELFRPEPRDCARWRLRWPENGRVVLFNAGYDSRVKRLDLAQHSIAIARETLPNLRLEVMRGNVDPAWVPDLMNASDCLLVTSEYEGSPTVVQEALACGLPVVSVDVGDVAERLTGVTNTRIVPRDAPSIARALVDLTTVPLHTDGPARAEEFSCQTIARRLCDLYRWSTSPF